MQLADLTIVFDLDGTLVDTAPDLAAATNHALASAGLTPLTVAQLRPLIGHGSRVMLNAGLRHHGLSLREPELSALHERFFAYYADHVAVSSQPYAGVRELLEALRRAGTRLAVCTNKYEHLSRALLHQLDLAPLFASIAGRARCTNLRRMPRSTTIPSSWPRWRACGCRLLERAPDGNCRTIVKGLPATRRRARPPPSPPRGSLGWRRPYRPAKPCAGRWGRRAPAGVCRRPRCRAGAAGRN
jgi:hypothetical protein